jgi:lipopolysaccharide export system permease protein
LILLLQRYIATSFLLPFLGSVVFFTLFLLTFELFRIANLLTTQETSLVFILELVGEIALTFLPLAVPLSLYFAVNFSLRKLSQESEYIALRASGLNKRQLFLPYFFIALFASLSVLSLNQKISPLTNRDLRKRMHYLSGTNLLGQLKSGQFFTTIPGFTLFAQSVSESGRNLEQLFLKTQQEDKQSTIVAKKGQLIYDRDEKTLVEKLSLQLFDGSLLTSNKNDDTERIFFKSYFIPLAQTTFSSGLAPDESFFPFHELWRALQLPQEELMKKYNFKKKDAFKTHLEFWNRLYTPLLCLLFTFLAFSLGVSSERSGKKGDMLKVFACLIAYYVLYFSLISLSRSERIPIPLAMTISASFLLGLSFYFYKRLDWQD